METFQVNHRSGKTAALEHSWVLSVFKWRLSVHSSVPLVSRWGCVVSFVAMRPLQACGAFLCCVLKLFLCAQWGPATRSHRQHGFKECVWKLRGVCVFLSDHDVLPWPDVEMVARGDKGLRKPNYITAVLQFPLHFPTLLPLERSNFSSTFASREVRSPQTQTKPSWRKRPVPARELQLFPSLFTRTRSFCLTLVHIHTLDRISCVLLTAGGTILAFKELKGGVTWEEIMTAEKSHTALKSERDV